MEVESKAELGMTDGEGGTECGQLFQEVWL